MPGNLTCTSMSSSGLDMSMRFMATVTISVSDALIASDIIRFDWNLPVPTNRRDLNVRPPITSSFILAVSFLLIVRFF